MKVEEVERVRELLERLGEEALIVRLDSFIALNEGLETKRGEDYIRLSILGFLEGLLLSLKMKYPGKGEIIEVYEEIKAKRVELDELFRKPAMQNIQ